MTELDVRERIETREEHDPVTGEPRAAHIVAPRGNRDAVAVVTEARIYGYPVEALCGHRFVPERDPKAYPLCSKCREIRESARPDQNPEDIPS